MTEDPLRANAQIVSPHAVRRGGGGASNGRRVAFSGVALTSIVPGSITASG